MSRWTSNTSPEQKAAAIEALCDREISAPRVSKMAAAGELGGLPPFDISPSSCRRLRTGENERRDRARRLSPENREKALDDFEARLLTLIADAVTKLEAGEKVGIPLGQIRTLQSTINEIRSGLRARRAARQAKSEPGREQERHHEEQRGSFVARLTGAAAADTQSKQDDETQQHAALPARVLNLPSRRPDSAA